MNRRSGLRLLAGLFLMSAGTSPAQDDPGKAVVGHVKVTVYYGTDGDPSAAGPRFKEVPEEIRAKLKGASNLDFKSYRVLGEDRQPLYRSYENWAQPLKPSDEVLLRFEAKSRPSAEAMRLDLELWFSRKKILKTDATLEKGRPLYVLGPEWRGGRLIVSVALASE